VARGSVQALRGLVGGRRSVRPRLSRLLPTRTPGCASEPGQRVQYTQAPHTPICGLREVFVGWRDRRTPDPIIHDGLVGIVGDKTGPWSLDPEIVKVINKKELDGVWDSTKPSSKSSPQHEDYIKVLERFMKDNFAC
jgi:hypothetical protein